MNVTEFYSKGEDRTAVVSKYLAQIRAERPVVQCITNIVTVNDCANALLAIGASPTMAHHPQEMADFAAICDALVCNLGATESLEAMGRAAALAASLDHPSVLDPVGCAGSQFRREQAFDILKKGRFSCIRGNAAEIRALAQHCNTGRGVDDFAGAAGFAGLAGSGGAACVAGSASHAESSGPAGAAGATSEKQAGADVTALARETGADVTALARETGAVVIASGETDLIGDGHQLVAVKGGSPMLAKITGSGCMLSALLGAFFSVERSVASAAACCALMADCGELAAQWTREAGRGTGTFHIALLDALSLKV